MVISATTNRRLPSYPLQGVPNYWTNVVCTYYWTEERYKGLITQNSHNEWFWFELPWQSAVSFSRLMTSMQAVAVRVNIFKTIRKVSPLKQQTTTTVPIVLCTCKMAIISKLLRIYEQWTYMINGIYVIAFCLCWCSAGQYFHSYTSGPKSKVAYYQIIKKLYWIALKRVNSILEFYVKLKYKLSTVR